MGDSASLLHGVSITPNITTRSFRPPEKPLTPCAEFGFKNVISFTGYRKDSTDDIEIPDDVGASNCVEGFKKIVEHAEKKNVTLCLEMLNTRASDHPMKGHPGYQGNHTDYCIDIIKLRVGLASPEAALRHLSRADHGRRRHHAHPPA